VQEHTVDDHRLRPEPDGYVEVRLGAARYLVGMSAIAEIGRLPKVTRVPGTPAWMVGVANWRGRILAVLDIRPLLDAPPAATGSLGRLVVLSKDSVSAGLVTEGVCGVVTCETAHLEPPPTMLDGDAGLLVAGQLIQPTGAIGVLDPDAVLGLRTRLPLARRAAS
jgi:purine-binding chemotaxis protein CheW